MYMLPPQLHVVTPAPPRAAYHRACQHMLYYTNTFLSVGLSSESATVLILQPMLIRNCHCSMHITGTHLENIDRGDFSRMTPWPSQATYDLIIKAGHDGAKALVNSPEGHLLKTVHVFVRVDIVLAAHWLTNDEVALILMINEIAWLNSAGMLAAFWKEPAALYDLEEIHDDEMDGFFHFLMQKSPGNKIARALYTEVLRVCGA